MDGRNGNDQESWRVSAGSADPPQGLSSPAQNLRNQSRCPSLGAHDRKRNGPWCLRLQSRSRATLFSELIERYIAEVAPKHKGAYSEIKRLGALKRHPLAGRIVATLTSSDFARYRDERLKIRKGNTVKRELALFQCVLEVARREWGIHLTDNPVRMVSRPSYNDERSRRLAPDEETYLLEYYERREDGTYADGSHS